MKNCYNNGTVKNMAKKINLILFLFQSNIQKLPPIYTDNNKTEM